LSASKRRAFVRHGNCRSTPALGGAMLEKYFKRPAYISSLFALLVEATYFALAHSHQENPNFGNRYLFLPLFLVERLNLKLPHMPLIIFIIFVYLCTLFMVFSTLYPLLKLISCKDRTSVRS